MKRNRSTLKGFTLVELLVVIVIIATLAALSFMGFGKIRASADANRAMASLRQLQVANTSYSTENNGKYCPVYGTDENGNANYKLFWFINPTYLGLLTGGDFSDLSQQTRNRNIPTSLMDPMVFRKKKYNFNELPASYGMNHEVNGNWGQKSTEASVLVSSVVNPSATCAFISATDWIAKYTGRFIWRNAGGKDTVNATEGQTPDGKIAYRHGGKAIVVYYDGHVGTVTPEDLKEFEKKNSGVDNQPFWKATTGS